MVLSRFKKLALLLCTFCALAMPLPIHAWSFTQWFSDCYRKSPISTITCTILTGGLFGWAVHKTYTLMCAWNKPQQKALQNPRSLSHISLSSNSGFISGPHANQITAMENTFKKITTAVHAASENNKRFLSLTDNTQTNSWPEQLKAQINKLDEINNNIKKLKRDSRFDGYNSAITDSSYRKKLNELEKSVHTLLQQLKKELEEAERSLPKQTQSNAITRRHDINKVD